MEDLIEMTSDFEMNALSKMPVVDESSTLLQGLHRQYQTLIHNDNESDSEDDDAEEGLVSSWLPSAPHLDPSWPATFKKSAALLVRHAPTVMSEARSDMAVSLAIGSPEFRKKPNWLADRPDEAPPIPQRLRGYSDDAPVLRLKLPLFDAKLSDTSWLPKKKKKKKTKRPKSMTDLKTTSQAEEDEEKFTNHPTIRKFRDQYSSWRKGSSKGATGELTNDRLDGLTVGGEEAEITDEIAIPEEQIELIEKDLLGIKKDAPETFSATVLTKKTYEVSEIPPYVPHYDEFGYLSTRLDSMTITNKRGEEIAIDGSTLTQTVLNGMNAMCGLGLLAMPFVMVEAGLLFIPLLFFVCFCSIHTLDLLDQCQVRTGSLSFPDVATAAFGTSGRWIAGVLCYFDLYAAGVGCMIITASSLDLVVQRLTGHNLGDANSKIVTAIIYLPLCLLKDLSFVSYLSMGGLLANLGTVLFVLTFVGGLCLLVGDGYDLDDDVSTANIHGTPSSEIINWEDWFTNVFVHIKQDIQFVGPSPFIPVSLILYQFTMHSLFPSLRASMANPTLAPQMSRIVLIVVAFFVVIFATLVYLILGSKIPELISTELGTSLLGMGVNFMVFFNSYSKFPLSLFPVCDAAIELFPNDNEIENNKNSLSANHNNHEKRDAHGNVISNKVISLKQLITVRMIAVGITLLTCIFVTGFASIIGLCSWIFAPALICSIPLLCYLRIFGDEISDPWKYTYYFFIILSMITSVVGTAMNIYYF